MSIEDFITRDGGITPTLDETLLVKGKTHGDYEKRGAFSDELKERFRRCDNWKCIERSHRDALDMIATMISRVLHGDPLNPGHWQTISGYASLVHAHTKAIKERDRALARQSREEVAEQRAAKKDPSTY